VLKNAMKILVVEDDSRVAAFVTRGLVEDGHVVDAVSDAEDGLSHAYVSQYDVMVIDVMLPGKSGFQMTSDLRSKGDSTPILLLTAKDTRQDIVQGLDVGADDYLPKPFDFGELLARLRALGRRSRQISEQMLRFDDLEMDRLRHEVRRGGDVIDLTPTEFKLLEVLMQDPGKVVRRTEILDRVWGMNFDPGTSLIDVHLANLRKKLEATGRPRVISTVKAVGFTLCHPEKD
jgi:two-component system, OmpR family, response regulator